MPREIDVAKLQGWLSKQRPVTVLDIRSQADREQWWIPGSIHADVYESLKAGEAGGLDTLCQGRSKTRPPRRRKTRPLWAGHGSSWQALHGWLERRPATPRGRRV